MYDANYLICLGSLCRYTNTNRSIITGYFNTKIKIDANVVRNCVLIDGIWKLDQRRGTLKSSLK